MLKGGPHKPELFIKSGHETFMSHMTSPPTKTFIPNIANRNKGRNTEMKFHMKWGNSYLPYHKLDSSNHVILSKLWDKKKFETTSPKQKQNSRFDRSLKTLLEASSYRELSTDAMISNLDSSI